MPFGLKMSQDVFQSKMDQLMEDAQAAPALQTIWLSMQRTRNNMTGTCTH